MMDRFREGMNGPLAWVLLALVFIAFVFTGAGTMLMPDSSNVIAKVEGAEITRSEFEQAYQNARARYGEMYAQIFNTEEKEQDFRRLVMQNLVSRTALQVSMDDLAMRVSADHVRDQIQEMEAFQRDGKYDEQTAEMRLMQAGYTKQSFRAQMEKDLSAMQLLRGLSATAFALPNESERFARLREEKLTGRFARLSSAQFMPTDAPTDVEIETYYQANMSQFAVPEQFNLEYVEVLGNDMRDGITVDDAALRDYYDNNASQYTGTERRTAAHILFAVEDAAKDAEVKAKAEAVLTELNGGADFAALAAQHSDDTLSKENGGQLEPMEKGFQDPAFDDAVFSLNVGAVSSLVRSEFGYHIVKLNAISGGEVQPFDAVKDTIRSSLLETRVYDAFAEKEQQLTDKGFETPDSLTEVANQLGLTVQETGVFSKGSPMGIARETPVMDAAITDDVLRQRRNSAVIRLADLRSVMIRIKDYQAASHKALADVKGQITAELNNQKAKAAVSTFGAELIVKASNGEDIGATLAEKSSNWESFDAITRVSPAPDALVKDQLFKTARPADKATVAGATLSDGSYLLVELTKAEQPDVTMLAADAQKTSADQLLRFNGESDYMAYVEWLKNASSIKYNDEQLKPKS